MPEDNRLLRVVTLTPRDRQIFVALGSWKSARQIAAEIGRGIDNVESYQTRLKKKLQCKNILELRQLAVKFVSLIADQEDIAA